MLSAASGSNLPTIQQLEEAHPMEAVQFGYLACLACGQPLKALDIKLVDAPEHSRAVCCVNQPCPKYMKGGLAIGKPVKLQDVRFELTQ